ncbi:hypothetical protein RUND412_010985 [Rhizina undulata]
MLPLFFLSAAAVLSLPFSTATPSLYTGPFPTSLPSRIPCGFAAASTGGNSSNSSSYIASTMPDLRSALLLPSPKIIYVNGTLYGNDLFGNGTLGDCQYYIDHSSVPGYNFTLYLLSLNETYVMAIEAAAEAGEEFEGRDAEEFRVLLGKQNGWRPVAQNVQKAWETVEIPGDTSLVGWDEWAVLEGVNLKLSSVDNVHVRNLKVSSPRDCFPAPETYPSTWNARYDAVSIVTATNVWFDGNILQDGDSDVPLEPFIDGWLVDRYDGLFDVEDGSDNITFSHNIVRNHHKSLLLGGGNKEADRDLGKMHFTIFGNLFNNSDSRNPLMRFGTFHIVNNVFSSTNNKSPIFTYNSSSSSSALKRRDSTDDIHPFQYHLGIYNQSSVLLSGNVFTQDGTFPDDVTRIFSYSDLTRSDIPARLCVSNDGGFVSTFNEEEVDLDDVARALLAYDVEEEKAVDGGLVFECGWFSGTGYLPDVLGSAEEVVRYVEAEAGNA